MIKERLRHYMLDISSMDDSHSKILLSLEELGESILGENISPETIAQLEKIKNQYELHLLSEEQAMVMIHYPYADAHIRSHRASRVKFSVMMRYLSKHGISDLICEILDHTDHYDRQLAEFYKALLAEDKQVA